MTRGPSVDGAVVYLGYVQRDAHMPQLLDEAGGVLVLVGAKRRTGLFLMLRRAMSGAASRSAVPEASVAVASTTSPLRFSIKACPR